MLSHFQTGDDAWWGIDTKSMTYGHWLNGETPELKEMGKLVAIGNGVFALEGRDPKTPAPGAGFCAVGFETYIEETELKIRVYANVPIKNYFMPNPVKSVRYIIVGQPPAALPGEPNAPGITEQKESSGSQEPEIGGSIPESPTGEQRTETEADVESPETGVGG